MRLLRLLDPGPAFHFHPESASENLRGSLQNRLLKTLPYPGCHKGVGSLEDQGVVVQSTRKRLDPYLVQAGFYGFLQNMLNFFPIVAHGGGGYSWQGKMINVSFERVLRVHKGKFIQDKYLF